MKRVICPTLPTPGRDAELPEREAHHVIQVLRLRNGDLVEAIDGKGHAVVASISIRGKRIALEHAGEAGTGPSKLPPTSAGQVVPLRLELAILKGDAMEWAVEKAVELGVAELCPLLTAHTVVQIDRKGPEAFQERWQKIADQALKQCGRLERMEVALPTSLEMHLTRTAAESRRLRLWCDEAEKDTVPALLDAWLELSNEATTSGLALLIGPEGGWSAPERRLLEVSASRVSLGPLVLRAETAALYGASVIAACLRSSQLDKTAQKKGN